MCVRGGWRAAGDCGIVAVTRRTLTSVNMASRLRSGAHIDASCSPYNEFAAVRLKGVKVSSVFNAVCV